MAIRRWGAWRAGVALAILVACAGDGPTGLTPAAEFRLLGVEGAAVPFVLSAAAGGRTIEVVAGALRFEHFGGRGGEVLVGSTLRITDPGRAPVARASEARARWARRGDTVEVSLPDGGGNTYELEESARRLRTVASRCGAVPSGGACVGPLHVYLYERVEDGP